MSQHDNDIANASGATVRADLNAALVAGAEKQSGASAPGTNFAFQSWVDTTGAVEIWKIRDPANSAHLKFARIVAGGVSVYGHKGSNIPSATTTDLSAAEGQFVDISGVTTITGFGTENAGVEILVRFTGALTLTYNATSLILPSDANILTVSGDTARFVSLGSGNWLCVQYTRGTGEPVKGVIGFSETHTTTDFTCSTDIPVDDTEPQAGDGDQILALNHTAKSTTSKLVITVSTFMLPSAGSEYGTVALGWNGATFCLASWPVFLDGAETSFSQTWVHTPGTMSARTYSVRVGPAVGGAASIAVNQATGAGGDMGDTIGSSLTVVEYA